ncbi:MAG TPA: hypothetical protein VGU02_11715 [Gaiellaceae bacterium]|nr:hypothetical protein [Gaiellaceae bacterium]
MSKLRIRPALVVSLLALFFALGGSAFALTKKPAPQPRCAQGAVRGIADVTGQTNKGPANIPDQYTSTAGYFARQFSCSGGGVQVRRLTRGVYDVRLPGNAATSAVASAHGAEGSAAAVQRADDGSFHVTVGYPGQLEDDGFTIVIF